MLDLEAKQRWIDSEDIGRMMLSWNCKTGGQKEEQGAGVWMQRKRT